MMMLSVLQKSNNFNTSAHFFFQGISLLLILPLLLLPLKKYQKVAISPNFSDVFYYGERGGGD
jgi:hypothetical protein